MRGDDAWETLRDVRVESSIRTWTAGELPSAKKRCIHEFHTMNQNFSCPRDMMSLQEAFLKTVWSFFWLHCANFHFKPGLCGLDAAEEDVANESVAWTCWPAGWVDSGTEAPQPMERNLNKYTMKSKTGNWIYTMSVRRETGNWNESQRFNFEWAPVAHFSTHTKVFPQWRPIPRSLCLNHCFLPVVLHRH